MLKKILVNTGITLVLPVAIYLIFVILTRVVPGAIPYGSWDLLLATLQNSAMAVLVALALCVNMPTGRIDMSAGSVVVLTAIVCGNLALEYHWNIIIMLIASIILAMILTSITGAVHVFLRLPAIIVSLGMVIIYEAITGIVFDGQGVLALGRDIRLLGYIPYCFIVVIAALIVFHIVTEHTKFAYHSKLLAGGQAMAVRIGVREKLNVIQSFALSGVFLGAAATIYISNYGAIEAATNMSSASVMFDSLLPVVIGLVLARFSCRAIGVAVSVISMKMISYGLFCLGYNASVQNVVSGIFILAIVVITGYMAGQPERNRIKQRAQSLREIIEQNGV